MSTLVDQPANARNREGKVHVSMASGLEIAFLDIRRRVHLPVPMFRASAARVAADSPNAMPPHRQTVRVLSGGRRLFSRIARGRKVQWADEPHFAPGARSDDHLEARLLALSRGPRALSAFRGVPLVQGSTRGGDRERREAACSPPSLARSRRGSLGGLDRAPRALSPQVAGDVMTPSTRSGASTIPRPA